MKCQYKIVFRFLLNIQNENKMILVTQSTIEIICQLTSEMISKLFRSNFPRVKLFCSHSEDDLIKMEAVKNNFTYM
jgi:hypothetical protein